MNYFTQYRANKLKYIRLLKGGGKYICNKESYKSDRLHDLCIESPDDNGYSNQHQCLESEECIGINQEHKLIQELSSEEKNKWIEMGSLFGQIDPVFYMFKKQVHKYKTKDGNIIGVHQASPKYDIKFVNVPVFEYMRIGDKNDLPKYSVDGTVHVDQAKYLIVDKEKELSTYGVATCTALGMEFGKYKFYTHLDALTDPQPMIDDIKAKLREQNMDSKDISKIRLWMGTMDADFQFSSKIALRILKELELVDTDDLSISNNDMMPIFNKLISSNKPKIKVRFPNKTKIEFVHPSQHPIL